MNLSVLILIRLVNQLNSVAWSKPFKFRGSKESSDLKVEAL